MKYPNLLEEKKLWKKGYKRVAGLDEAGRGPLAGPVVAAAVILIRNKRHNFKPDLLISDIGNNLDDIKDSKKLTPQKRSKLFDIIIKNPRIEWGIGIVSEKMIDKINIKNAAELAMEKAINKLKKKPDFLIIDGNNVKSKGLKKINYKLIVGADEKVFSCATASILAKVARDKFMEKEHKKYSQYGFSRHKGYPTKFHKKMLGKYGPCVIHRRSFLPVKNMVK